MNRSLDILITTAGAWPYPERLIETILGRDGKTNLYPNGRKLPDGVRLLIRDNPASKRDATFKYLVEIAREFGPARVLLFSPDWSGEHGHNLDFLLTKAHAEWGLAVDSDIEFLTPHWFDEIQSFIDEHPNMEVAVEMATANSNPNDMAMLPDGGEYPRRWIPRSTSYFMLFKPSWMRTHQVSFGRGDYDVRPVFRDVFPYSAPGYIGDAPRQRWTLDHGWQLLWAGLNCNEAKPFTCVQIPPRIAKTYIHHFHKICGFMLKVGDKPNAPTNREHWGEDIPQLIPTN
jgi:hypothetical protein